MSVARSAGGGSLIDVLDRVLAGGIVVVSTQTRDPRGIACAADSASVAAVERRTGHAPARTPTRAGAAPFTDAAWELSRAHLAVRRQLDRLGH